MHFEVDRSLSDDVNAELQERVRRILADVAAVVRDFDPMQERVRHMIELARAAEVTYPPALIREVVEFLEWLLQLNFVPRLPRVRAERHGRGPRDPSRPRQRARDPLGGRHLDVRGLDAAVLARPRHPQPDRGRRAADLLEDPGVLDGSPPRADGLHRRPEGGRPRHDRRRGPPDRAVHEQGVHGARHEDPLLHHKLEQVIAGGGPDPRIARLQGRRVSSSRSPRTSCSRRRPTRSASWSSGCSSSRSTAASGS